MTNPASWPESATPFYFEEDPASGNRIRRLVQETGIELLFGSDQLERTTPPLYYNSAFLLRRDGAMHVGIHTAVKRRNFLGA